MTEVRHEERAHSRLGASGAHRWMACPGSLRLTANMGGTSSIYAAEGTAAHEVGERCLRSGGDAADHLGESITVGNHAFVVDEEMAEAVQVYLDTVRADFEEGDILFVEAHFNLSHLYPGMFGKNDAGIYKTKTGKLIVYDYKHGKGYAVDVVRNPQLIYYGVGNITSEDMKTRPIDEVELVIVQPRAGGAPVRRWQTDALELLSFSGDLVKAAKATEDPNAPLAAGDWCKFCAAAGVCPAMREEANKAASAEFSEDPELLTGEELAAIMARADFIKSWIKAVSAEAFRRMKDGGGVPGYKFVAKRARRAWIDENQTAQAVKAAFDLADDDIYAEPKIKSPAQLEKLLPKADRPMLASLITAESTGVSLVPESDKRPAVAATMAAADDFDD